MHTYRNLAVVLISVVAVGSLGAQSATEYQRMGREVLKELVETDTTHATGSTTIAAERMAVRLLAAGFPKADVQVVRGGEKEAETKGNLVVRYRGKGTRKPILFIAHLDVVAAKREDWSMDPFVLNEKDGYFYGRGTQDQKGGAATLVAAFVRLRQEQWVPDRDLILALTADEEGGTVNGVTWLLENRRELVAADYSINIDTGGGELRGGKVTALDVQAAEKVFASFSMTVKNPGGHSSLPTKENAIYRLGRRTAAPGGVRISGPPHRHHPDLLRSHGRILGRERRRHAGGGAPGARPGGRGAPGREVTLPQRAPSYDLRRDDAAGGSRRERAAADGAGDRQLPAAADRRCGCRPEGARPRPCRSANHRGAHRHAYTQPALAPGARATVRNRSRRESRLGKRTGRPHHSLHGNRGDRRPATCATPGFPSTA